MKPTVFIDRRLSNEVLAFIAEHCLIKTYEPDEKRSRTALLNYLHDCDGLFLSSSEQVNEELLQCGPQLKVVSTMSVGYNHFDLAAMDKHCVIGTHTPFVLDETVADLVLALMLDCARRVSELDSYIKQGSWKGNEGKNLFGVNVHHKTIGIIGAGRIGEAILQRAVHGFNMQALYHNRTKKEHLTNKFGANFVELDTLLQNSDFVVMMAPLTTETYQLLTYDHFKLMKKSAIFINASRGSTINEADLVKALQEGLILGAGLDVFEQEPLPADHPLLQMKQVVLTPHIGSATAETREAMAMLAAKNLVHALLNNGPYYDVVT